MPENEGPKPGDGVVWPDGKMGRVWTIGGQGFCDPDEVHVCAEQGSAFTRDSGVTVQISGGPFYMLKASDLAPTSETYTGMFWRWGPNGPGGGNGVTFTQERPVWRYTGAHDYYKGRDGQQVLRIQGTV